MGTCVSQPANRAWLQASWSCGEEQKLLRNTLLVDRAAELVHSNMPRKDVALETKAAQGLLDGIYTSPNWTEAPR